MMKTAGNLLTEPTRGTGDERDFAGEPTAVLPCRNSRSPASSTQTKPPNKCANLLVILLHRPRRIRSRASFRRHRRLDEASGAARLSRWPLRPSGTAAVPSAVRDR
jgi:hypothetical protein